MRYSVSVFLVLLASIGCHVTLISQGSLEELNDSLSRKAEDPLMYSHVLQQPIPAASFGIDLLEKTISAFTELMGGPLVAGAIEIPYLQKIIVPDSAKLVVFGDIHGSAHSLVRSLKRFVDKRIMADDLKILDSDYYFIFLGDYIDRGFFSTEVLYLIMRLKLQNPDKVYLMSGNHEGKHASPNNFVDEVQARYGAATLSDRFYRAFTLLPSALFVGTSDEHRGNNFILFCHGGIARHTALKGFLDNATAQFMPISFEDSEYFKWNRFQRDATVPTAEDEHGFLTMGRDEVEAWLHRNSTDTSTIKFIVHGHQHADLGTDLIPGNGAVSLWDGLVQTIISAAASEGVWLPFDSFLVVTLAPFYDRWDITHFWRKIGKTANEINIRLKKVPPLTIDDAFLIKNTKTLHNIAWQTTPLTVYGQKSRKGAGMLPPVKIKIPEARPSALLSLRNLYDELVESAKYKSAHEQDVLVARFISSAAWLKAKAAALDKYSSNPIHMVQVNQFIEAVETFSKASDSKTAWYAIKTKSRFLPKDA